MILRETVPFIVQQPYAVFGKVGRTAPRDSSVQLYSRPMYSNVIVYGLEVCSNSATSKQCLYSLFYIQLYLPSHGSKENIVN